MTSAGFDGARVDATAEGPSASAPLEAKVRKFPCASCGADVVWSPGGRSLVCPYCGGRRELATTTDAIRERALHEALREPRDLGWGAERKVVNCRKCGARTTLEPVQAAGSCAFCGTPGVVEAPPNSTMVRPEGVLAFTIERNTAIEKFRHWLHGLWFRPNDLKKKSTLTKMQGVYIPFWTFDAATESAWTAEAGHYYYVNAQQRRGGRVVNVRERRVRWEPAAGTLEKFFDDVPVPASRGLEQDLTKNIEPFPTASIVPYEPAYLSGFLAEEYAVGLEEAWGRGKQRMNDEIRAACAAAVPGDTYRNLEIESSFDGIAYKNALLPVWIAAYEYGGTTYRFLVNGVTGRISGRAPFSWVKIGLVAVAIVVVALAVLAMAQ